jgi:tetratricopeptide (TPR) repeat protein
MLRKKYINYIDSGKKKERIKILKKIAELLEKLLQQKDTPEKKRQELLVSYAMTYKEMINIYLEEEKPKQCLEICEEVLEKNLVFPFLSDKILFSKIYIYHTMSRLHMQLGNQKLAEVYAFKILEIEPENHFAKIAYGELLYFIGQLEKATEVFQNLYEIVEEEIAQIKSNKFLDKGRLQILYTTLTMLIATWVKQLDLLKIPINSSELLKLLIEELLTVDFVERDVFIALSSYAELINSNNYPLTDIKNLIQLAVEIYGPSLLRLLISVPEVYNNKELYSFLENFIKEFDYDEEFD